MIYLSITAVADRCACSEKCARLAIQRGELRPKVGIVGPNGRLITWGVTEKEASRWEQIVKSGG